MNRNKYAAAAKGAVLAALLAGDTPHHVAQEHGIPLNTVKSWRRRLKRGEIRPFAPKKKNSTLLQQHILASLRSLIVQARHISDKAWLHEQSAGGLALLEGTMFDRTLRSLEMLGSLRDRGEV